MTQHTAPSHTVTDSHRVTDLLRLCTSDRVAQDKETANAYALVIHELLNAYTQVAMLAGRRQDFVPVIFVWPIAIPQTYLILLGEPKPEEMVILAHYPALLQQVDDQWFMKGWARYSVMQIATALGEEWQAWLTWPKEVTGVQVALPQNNAGEISGLSPFVPFRLELLQNDIYGPLAKGAG
ncbi:hypothetical protein ACO22_02959 [Paracoccidioides brasiliensis]|uniref:Uncharacterized protein n=1 Tax=Paracoccidioides brasiliensis TaxID=121759 RepID=A0A1D2JHI0_PARBR|nr:hypothetical protein ACO22_02959 [Paracoccidioides brasiliensis]